MLAEGYRFLKKVNYKDFYIWDVKRFQDKSVIWGNKYPIVTLNQFLSETKIEKIKIEDTEKYPILGVRTYGKGVYLNRIADGIDLKMREYQKSQVNHLFWCKVDTKNGAFGVINEEFAETFASTNMTYLKIDIDQINIDYLQLFFTIEKFQRYIDNMVVGVTNRRYISKLDLLNKVTIPLPTATEQEAIVKQYNHTYSQAEECEIKAKELEESIDTVLFEELGIEIQAQDNEKSEFNFIKLVHYQNLIQWSVKKNTLKSNPSSLYNSRKYENKPLSSVAEINPTTSFNTLDAEDTITFLPMECISDIYGEIVNKYEGKKDKSKGYTRFKEQDILWAKITPCMQNGKCAIVANLLNGFGYGSTEYHVIRAKKKLVQTEYIYHFLRTKTIREVAQCFFTGSAGQQRVSADFLEILSLPIPPLDIQKEISQKITTIKTEIKELRQKAESLRIKAKSDFESEVFSDE